jgi:mannitol-specific phosphotransferase system IIBC component
MKALWSVLIMMSETLGLAFESTTALAIVAAVLTFLISALVFVCDNPSISADLEAAQNQIAVPRRKRGSVRSMWHVHKQTVEARLQHRSRH